jgi:hypothetical protein
MSVIQLSVFFSYQFFSVISFFQLSVISYQLLSSPLQIRGVIAEAHEKNKAN